MKKATAIITFFAITLASEAQSLLQLKWLEGKWHQPNTDRFEEWHFASDTVANGTAYIMSDDGEAVLDEIMQIKNQGQKLWFTALVKKKDTEEPVSFEIVAIKENSFFAENAKHDFPQRIVYQLKGGNRLKAYIEDLKKTKRVNFLFQRSK